MKLGNSFAKMLENEMSIKAIRWRPDLVTRGCDFFEQCNHSEKEEMSPCSKSKLQEFGLIIEDGFHVPD